MKTTKPTYLFSLASLFIHVLTFITLSVTQVSSQNSSILDTEFSRLNFQEFDASLSEPEIADRLFCDKWCTGQVITMVDTMDIKYNFDLLESIFYFNMNEKIFSIKSDFIKSFIIDNRTFINYRLPQSTKPMILELLVDGKVLLYKHHGIDLVKANFDPLLNVGSKTDTYKKFKSFYAFCDDRLIEIPNKVKKSIKKLHNECGTPKDLKVKGDLIDLFNIINESEK